MLSDNQALLKAIIAHPDEDTPRLALADWLDENGAPKYAAFIRKQVELADVPEHDPRWVQAWHHDRDVITGRGFDAFLPNLPNDVDVEWDTHSFRRGFPWAVRYDSPARFLADAPALFAVAPVGSLAFRTQSHLRPMELAELTASPWLAKIRHLSFSLSRLSAKEIDRLRTSPHAANVTSLALKFNGILTDDAAVRAVFHPDLVSRLERLSLDNNELVWTRLLPAIEKVGASPRLRALSITEYTPRLFVAFKAFDAPLFRGLKELDLSCAEMEPDGAAALCHSPVLSSLESLNLSRTMPGADGAKALAACDKLAGLRSLVMARNNLGPVAAKALAKSPHLSNLSVLDLNDNPIGDKGAVALAESPHLRNLVELNLMHCAIGDAGAEALLDSPNAQNLIYLCVHGDHRRGKISPGVEKKLRDRFGDRVSV